jgi:hypothetical protein
MNTDRTFRFIFTAVVVAGYIVVALDVFVWRP